MGACVEELADEREQRPAVPLRLGHRFIGMAGGLRELTDKLYL
jgi:hypothetical protein